MVKKVNWLANLRVDVEDIDHGTNEYSSGVVKESFIRTFQDNYARILDGFRVEVADQTTSPGLFTVYNGVGLDADGQLVSNEDQYNTSRSVTLTADATYYVEVEFITNETDTDGRGFWDPSFDNGLDTSGDILPDGREFSQNVATRLLHDWQVSTPISTANFSINSDPNTNKLPVAIITRAGGVITGTTVIARTCLAQGVLAAQTSLRVFDSRLFPDSFSLTVGSGEATEETATVTANDRENGILSLSAGLSNPHSIGERLVINDVSPSQFLQERTSHDPIIPTTDGDARGRFWQANEEVGYGLQQDPYGTGTNDVQLKQLKDYVDFLGATIREIKWGSGRASDVGNVAPPTSFSAAPRYYDSAGSLSGARTNTVSVGDGVTTFGDFNVTQTGSAQAALQAAIDTLPAEGGIVYVKAGTYTITSTSVTIDKALKIVGDGIDATILTCNSTVPVFSVDTAGVAPPIEFGGIFRIEDVAITASGAVSACIQVTGTNFSRISAKRCIIYGVQITGAGDLERSRFEDCELISDNNSTTGIVIDGEVTDTVFDRCIFSSANASATSRAVSLATTSGDITFRDCSIASNAAATEIITLLDASNVSFYSCEFTGTTQKAMSSAGASSIKLDGCNILCNGIGDFDSTTDVFINNCNINFDTDDTGVELSNSSSDCYITNCKFEQDSAGTSGVGTSLTSVDQVHISGCTYLNCDRGIELGTNTSVTVDSIVITGTGITEIGIGSQASASVGRLLVCNSTFRNLTKTGNTVSGGVYLAGSGRFFDRIVISNCMIEAVGSDSTQNAFGIEINSEGSQNEDVKISNCTISGISSTTRAEGVNVGESRFFTFTNNTIRSIGANGAAPYWHGIQLEDPEIGVTISNNVFESLGNPAVGAAGSNPAAIKVNSGTHSFTCDTLVISGNSVRNMIHNSEQMHGIIITEDAKFVTISNNVITLDDDDQETGITVTSNTDGAPSLRNIAINGNVITGTHLNGINVLFSDSNVNNTGQCVISGNLVEGSNNRGIAVTGVQFFTQNIAINGNVIYSIRNSVIGITLNNIEEFSVVGNTVNLTSGTGPHRCLDFLGTCTLGSVTGNHFSHDGSTGGAVNEGDNASWTMYSGNSIQMLASTGTGLTVGSNSYAVGNIVTTNGFGTNIAGSGGGLSKARKDSDVDGNPASVTDVGLNYRP